MRLDDFFIDSTDTSPWGLPSAQPSLNTELLQRLLRAPDPNRSDVEVAVALARLLHDEFEKFGTSGGEVLDDIQMRDALRTLRVMVDRIGISGFDPPFRDFAGFRNYWKREGMSDSGGYALRRNCLAGIFNDLHDQLEQLEVSSLTSTIADPVSTHTLLGWPVVDMELNELRRHFAAARTPQDYRGVGNDCVHVTEALSRHVYDPTVHLRPGETEPAVSQTKNRLDRYVEDTLLGPDNAALRKLAKATIELAQQVKHSSAPTRTEAGIAADAVILLANMLRRIGEPS